jgi:diamine N-acetyltransferase
MNLETDKIKIELTRVDDIGKIIQIENDNSNFIGQCDYNGHKRVIESADEIHFSILDKADNTVIGHIILAGLKNENDSIEFRRIVISKKGKGLGRESISLIKKYCFENLKAHRIWLDVYDDNMRAIGLYKSQGFKIDGLLRECIKQDGIYRSLLIMSLLAIDNQSNATKINYNNRRFVAIENSDNGEVTPDLIFHYLQNDNIITSDYSGDKIKKGQLIGLVDNKGCIDMRYHQVNLRGELMTGICKSTPEIMANGKIRLYEKWSWTSGDKTDGESILEEI